VVEPPVLKNVCQIRSSPQIPVNIKKIFESTTYFFSLQEISKSAGSLQDFLKFLPIEQWMKKNTSDHEILVG